MDHPVKKNNKIDYSDRSGNEANHRDSVEVRETSSISSDGRDADQSNHKKSSEWSGRQYNEFGQPVSEIGNEHYSASKILKSIKGRDIKYKKMKSDNSDFSAFKESFGES